MSASLVLVVIALKIVENVYFFLLLRSVVSYHFAHIEKDLGRLAKQNGRFVGP